MANEKNGIHLFVTILSIVGTGLIIIISLSTILGWKMDDSVGKQIKILGDESDKKYVLKELYDLQIETINKSLKAIIKAVGARQPSDVP
jgi:hypothetical protein